MCGIHVSICVQGYDVLSHGMKHLLCNRGPDHLGEAQAQLDAKNGLKYWLSFTSTVLSLRGGCVTVQPFVDPKTGSVFCWNGEAWKIGSEPIVGNDGQIIFDLLLKASSAQKLASESSIAVIEVLQSISGPFAFVFLDKTHGQMYFGRDRLGRRSLLYNADGHNTYMEFASIADTARQKWKEVEADAVYLLSFHDETLLNGSQNEHDGLSSTSIPLRKHIWQIAHSDSAVSKPGYLVGFQMQYIGIFNRAIPTQSPVLNAKAASIGQLRYHLCESLKLRILEVPVPPSSEQSLHVRVAVLFSGGLDCTVLARMAHDLLPSDQQIDLLNVAFENPRVIQAAKNAPKPKKQTSREGEIRSTMDRGGMNPGVTEVSPFEQCPDRETGRKAFQELQQVCPGRMWRFVAVNVPYTEMVAHRANVINLIHPHNTEMDLSIACALYFAARGTGVASSSLDSTLTPYATPARVLLSGLGADELFGGYTRHATAFNRKGFAGLLDELELDVIRLGKRNLGRDDRVISHWGREVRFPYLDESLVKWAVECPIWEKCGFQLKDSELQPILDLEPGKKVLRLLAHELGMQLVAREPKRAIQFGARTAKMELGRTKGTALIS